jgi:hypothetical protein
MKTRCALSCVAGAFVAGMISAEDAVRARASLPSESAPVRERAISARSAALLAAAMPKFEPLPTTAAAEPVIPSASDGEIPAAGIVRLPEYFVRERKLPTAAEVEKAEVARRAMEKYLGPENGLDRGVLNLITSKQIPFLRFLGSISNEARAMARYREDERLQLKADLLELAALTKLSGDASGGARIKREVQETFRP